MPFPAPLILTVNFQRRAVQIGSVDNVATSVPTIGSAVRENAARVPVARRNVLMAAAEKTVTSARTVRSVIPENAVTIATAKRNAPTVVVEKAVPRARTVRSVVLESAVTRIIPVRAFVLILASLGQPLEALSLAVWFLLPL